MEVFADLVPDLDAVYILTIDGRPPIGAESGGAISERAIASIIA